MARPKLYEEPRVNTAVRLPRALHSKLRKTAYERELGVNLLITRAIESYLAGLEAPPPGLKRRRSR